MAGRILDDWLSSYLKFCENTEPPLSFHTWAGVSTIASCLQRRVYMKWGHETIYPNQYIILVGPSGQSRKGVAIGIAKDLLENTDAIIIGQSITREKLIRTMASCTTNFIEEETDDIMWQSAVSQISGELSVFLGQGDINFLANLTDWYDSLDVWKYETKNMGDDKIMGVCMNLLGATAPDWISSMLPMEAIGGGFTSRAIFVVEEGKSKIISNPNLIDVDMKLKASLLLDLERIFAVTGEFMFDTKALKLYTNWYEADEAKMEKGTFPISDPRFAGYCARRATHIKKLCMAISISRSDSLIITENDFNRGISILTAAERKMTRAFEGVGRSPISELTSAVLRHIMKHKKYKRSEILKQFFRDIDIMSMDMIEKILEQMGVITVTQLIEEHDVLYTYIGEESDVQ